MEFCKEIGAVVHIGRRVLYDREIIDQAISERCETIKLDYSQCYFSGQQQNYFLFYIRKCMSNLYQHFDIDQAISERCETIKLDRRKG